MYFPTFNDTGAGRTVIDAWLGYNHNLRINDGEFFDMENMSGDYYPVLTPRAKRRVLFQLRSDEMVDLDLDWKVDFAKDLTGARCTYTSEIYMAGIMEIAMEMRLNAGILAVMQLDIKLISEGKVTRKIEQDFYPQPANEGTTDSFHDFIFETDADTDTVQIAYTIIPKEKSNFVQEDLDIYFSHSEKYRNDVIRGLCERDGKLAYVIGDFFHYGEDFVNIGGWCEDPYSDLQLLKMGTKILIFPAGIYYDTERQDIYPLGAKTEYHGDVTLAICDVDGAAINAVTTKPAAPTHNQYWLDNDSGALKRWDESMKMWHTVLSTYIKISGPDFSVFKEGDSILMNTGMKNIDNGSIIRSSGDNYVIVTGLMTKATQTISYSGENFVAERRIPHMDHVCVSGNRVWGCYYGETDKGTVNEIYASKLGDPTNFSVFDGLTSDSYALSVGSDGPWTGCIEYQGMPHFFKEDIVYKIYGAYPAMYQLITYNVRGVQKGSHKSLAVVGENLFYKSVKDVVVFDGSRPTGISVPLGGREVYYEARAGAAVGKYYMCCKDASGTDYMFVFDADKNLWYKEDSVGIKEFAYLGSGKLYGASGIRIYGLALADDSLGMEMLPVEDYVKWYCETGKMGMEYPDHKYVSRVTIRADIPYKSELNVEVSFDGKPWKTAGKIRGDGTTLSYSVHVPVYRCDNYRLRFSGHGDVAIYSLARDIEEGSDESD